MHSAIERVAAQPELLDQRIVIRNAPWKLFTTFETSRGERSVPRVAYFEGALELMSPSETHDRIALVIHDLIRAFADEEMLDLEATGSWTLRDPAKGLAAEADQSYVLGEHRKAVPDLVVEVIWTHGGIDKLAIYAGLGVREVWMWRDGAIEVYVLGAKGYARRQRSKLLPTLDVELLNRFVKASGQTKAIRGFRAELRKRRKSS